MQCNPVNRALFTVTSTHQERHPRTCRTLREAHNLASVPALLGMIASIEPPLLSHARLAPAEKQTLRHVRRTSASGQLGNSPDPGGHVTNASVLETNLQKAALLFGSAILNDRSAAPESAKAGYDFKVHVARLPRKQRTRPQAMQITSRPDGGHLKFNERCYGCRRPRRVLPQWACRQRIQCSTMAR